MSALFDRIINLLAWIAGALLLFEVVSITLEVMMRYFFGVSISWVIALNEWSLLYIAFLGAAWLQRQDGHVRLDILIIRFGRRTRLQFDLFAQLIGVLVCAVLVWFGSRVTWEKILTNEYDYFKVEDVPIYIIFMIIPIGSLFFLIQLLRDIYASLRSVSAPQDPGAKTTQIDL